MKLAPVHVLLCFQIDYMAAPICQVGCGAEFSMFVSVDGKLYSAGLPEYGQLGKFVYNLWVRQY